MRRFSALSFASDKWAGTEIEVTSVEADEFADTQTGRDGQDQHCLIASADPRPSRWCCQQCPGFFFAQVGQCWCGGLRRSDAEDLADSFRVFRVVG